MEKEQETNWSLVAATSVLAIGLGVIFKYVIQFNKEAQKADEAESSDDEGDRVRRPDRGAEAPAEHNRAVAIIQRAEHDVPVKNTRYRKRLEDKELAREQKAEEERKEAELVAAKEEQEFQAKIYPRGFGVRQQTFDIGRRVEWKGLFEVKEAGYTGIKNTMDSDKFVRYIRMRKVVVLQDLAFEFKMSTEDCIDRIRSLDSMGLFDGFFDDRGKYIWLDKQEMQACATALLKKGRINRTDLVSICNTTIRTEPTEEHQLYIEQEERRAVAALDWEDDEA
eukprot:GEMP01024213.1.p1 GENE.GEMP01024213.1~~GEMP01024213.1.p1  ORF type:complete len:280 (+),score=76.36 GEMP01024213.1:54-893(+)